MGWLAENDSAAKNQPINAATARQGKENYEGYGVSTAPKAPPPPPAPNGASSFWSRIGQVGIGAVGKVEAVSKAGARDVTGIFKSKPAPPTMPRQQGIRGGAPKFDLKSVTNEKPGLPGATHVQTKNEAATGKFLDVFSNAIKGTIKTTGKALGTGVEDVRALTGLATGNKPAAQAAMKRGSADVQAAEGFARIFPQTAAKIGLSFKGNKTFTPGSKLEKVIFGNNKIGSIQNTYNQTLKQSGSKATAAGATALDIITSALVAYGGVEAVKGGLESIPTEKTTATESTVPNEQARAFFNEPNPKIDPKTSDLLRQALDDNKQQFVKELRQGEGVTVKDVQTVPTVYGKLLNIIKDKLAKNEPVTQAEAAVVHDAMTSPDKYVDTKALAKVEKPSISETLSKVTPKIAKPKVSLGLGESGAVKPGAAASDIQDMIAKHQATTKYSGDIQRGGAMVEGAKKAIASDAVKVARSMPKLSTQDKQILQDYRDNKEAGLLTEPLPKKLQAANDDITALNKAATAAKRETARLEGRPFNENVNPETYVHREAVGKNTAFDKLLQGGKGRIPSPTSFAKGVSSNKGRVLQAVTDSSGKRQVVAIKNESFGKIKHLTGFENGKPVKLGRYQYDAKTNTLTNAKGEKLKLSQATTTEITKASGQKYYVDPHLTSLKNYVDARTALENVKFIESIKQHPDFELFASPPDEVAPKDWQSVNGLMQFPGYKFEPKTAEALRDIVKSGSGEVSISNKVGNVLKRTIVYFPLKHNLNQTVTYAVDRGLATLANPLAYKRGITSLVKAYQEVTNQGPIYQELLKKGFSLPSTDEKAFTDYVTKELKSLHQDDPTIIDTAKAWGVSPVKLYNAVQHMAVWEFGDILNVARVIERMSSGPLKKGMSLDDAMRATERYSLQYKVPSRVGGKLTGFNIAGKNIGRSASQALQSPIIFFGRYKYDLYKIMTNSIKDTVNLKTLPKNPKANFDAASRLAAMAVGAAVIMPLLNKALQKLSKSANAHMTAPGALEIPEMIKDIKSGKKTLLGAVSGQPYVSGALTIPLDVMNNLDSFTGKKIYDPNAPLNQQYKQVGAWLISQTSFSQKAGTLGNAGGNKAIDIFLSLASVNFPKNSSQTSKLYSLQYDTLPMVQTKAKALAKKGDFGGAQKVINDYNNQVMTAAKSALQAANLPVPSDKDLQKKLKAAGAFYAPKAKTIQGWQTKQPQNAKTLLGL